MEYSKQLQELAGVMRDTTFNTKVT